MKRNLKHIHFMPIIPRKYLEQFSGQTAAVINGKVVAAGVNTQEAIQKALKKYPHLKEWDVTVMSIPPRDGVWIV